MFHNSIIFIKIISVKSKIRKYSETEHNGIKNLKKINAYNKSEVNAWDLALDESPESPPEVGKESTVGSLDQKGLFLLRRESHLLKVAYLLQLGETPQRRIPNEPCIAIADIFDVVAVTDTQPRGKNPATILVEDWRGGWGT